MAERTGVLSSKAIPKLIKSGAVDADVAIEAGQIQPASLDLRLGPVAHRVRASFLPGRESVGAKIARLGMHEIDLGSSAVLERGCVYIVPLMERLSLAADISAYANPKSSTGRLDIFTRLITDGTREFDRVRRGYRGPLYAEVSPRTFNIVVKAGSRLNQLRFNQGTTKHAERDLQRMYKDVGSVKGSPGELPLFLWEMLQSEEFARGVPLSVDLVGDGICVGWKAKRDTKQPIDVSAVGCYEPTDYWEPITPPGGDGLILDPDEFYILASKEAVSIPPDRAAEMVAYDTLVGEFRAHYAGFFDPGFGYNRAGGKGARAVLEVRSHDVPFVMVDGQTVGRLLFEPLTERPRRLYGRGSSASYQRQGLALAKQFRQPWRDDTTTT